MRYVIAGLVQKYFNKKLDDGHQELVFGLSSYWGSLQGLGKRPGFYVASAEIQERLIHEFGYHRCPSCLWATTRPHTGWCTEQQEPVDTENWA